MNTFRQFWERLKSALAPDTSKHDATTAIRWDPVGEYQERIRSGVDRSTLYRTIEEARMALIPRAKVQAFFRDNDPSQDDFIQMVLDEFYEEEPCGR